MFTVLPLCTVLLQANENKTKKDEDILTWLTQCNSKTVQNLECHQKFPKEETLKRRDKVIGKALEIHFKDNPIKIVRGLGTYLYDENGKRYLDCINNVTQVGHCHPHVVRACNNQMKQLNTNNRFLHDSIVEYAERIVAKLPEKLKVCFFVVQGGYTHVEISEANDLALLMAKLHTGNEDIIVLDHAYHGHTNILMDISPYKQKQMKNHKYKDFVHVITSPDPYRGKYLGYDEETGIKYANEVKSAIEEAHGNGRKIAAFIAESAQGCGGQLFYPDGFLKHSFEHVRNAGGVCIADEVQTGFGRCGDFWMFEHQNVVPDIVTMGKPIANGHPVSLVVTTSEISDSFVAKGPNYFNTFGGNPVSCEVAHAVLDVIEQEKLQENAVEVGNFLMKHLKELQKVHPIIGDVRGKGLFIGVEWVTDRELKTPATAEAALIKEKLRDRYIITSVDGPGNNVFKLKPPLCFTQTDAEFLLVNLNEVLCEVEEIMKK